MGNGTSVGRVRGLGPAHAGTRHWLLQRFTAAGNVVAGLWLVFALLGLPDHQYATVLGWAAHPLPATMLGLLLVSALWHARLGLQVLVEDYLHDSASKFTAVLVLNLAAFAAAGFGLLCAVRLATGAR